MITRYTTGNATVTLSGDAERIVRAALEAAGGETVRVLETAAQEVADKARSDWYGPNGVKRRTGRSGQIEVVTTVSDTEVRVSVGSTDHRKDGKGKWVPAVVRRPGPLATEPKPVSRGEWWAWKKARKPVGKPGTGEDDWTILVPTQGGDGALLLQELVRKPMRAKIRVVTPELGRTIAARSGGA